MRVDLEKIKFGFMQIMSKHFLDSGIDARWNMMGDLEIMCTGYLLGEPQPDIDIEYPKDWWQAFKERWFPKWLLNKYPVIKRYHTLRRNIVYPELKVSLPLNTHRLICDYITGVRFPEKD